MQPVFPGLRRCVRVEVLADQGVRACSDLWILSTQLCATRSRRFAGLLLLSPSRAVCLL